MFNTKLMTIRKMKRLRINVLMSAHAFGKIPLFFALFSALAGGATVTTLLT